MNIGELNSYVRDRCGGPDSKLLHSEEITLALLEEITMRQSQMISAGKPFTETTVTWTPATKSGVLDSSVYSGKMERPDYARVKPAGGEVYDLFPIVNDIDALTAAESIGQTAILLYGSPLKYELSWTPNGETVQFWWDADVSSLSAINTAGTKLPARFDFAIGDSAAIKLLQTIALRDESKKTFAEIQSKILAENLLRWEGQWNEFLFRSVSSGYVGQIRRWKPNQTRRIRNLPY